MNQQTAPTEGKTQDLRGFTAKVCRADKKAVIGTAFAVDRSEALLVTCKHVVRKASPDPPGEGARVWLYLPQLPEGSDKIRLARVARCFDECDDDVMVLQLDPPELPAEMEVASLGEAKDSVGFDEPHKFRSFGYRRLANYQGLPAYGEIIEFADKPTDRVLHGEPVMLQSENIDRGMSGAAVLDLKRNLVVGVIAETWDSGRDFADRDTSFAVDGAVLRLPPLGLPLHDALPLAASPQPSEVEQAAAREAPPQSFPLQPAFHNAPPSLGPEWAGREEMLAGLTADWADPATRVAGLIGFGGEGKSSLARKWVGEMLAVPPIPPKGGESPKLPPSGGLGGPPPDGIFWWGFYESRSVDAFMEAALTYLGGVELTQRAPSASVRAGIIGALLQTGRFLFVLDGLEVMQHQAGDRYGFLRSNDLRQLLELFAAPGHESFCLVTSRAPLLDLLRETAYRQHDLERLDPADARALLRNLGVKAEDEALDNLSQTWDGHALTLSLLGSDISERYAGDLAKVADLPLPEKGEGRYERVGRVLRRYDEHLTEAERAFLTMFSAFRLPVHESALDPVFRTKPITSSPAPPPPNSPAPLLNSLAPLSADAFTTLLNRLRNYRLLRYNKHEHHYTTHPLIRNYYAERLQEADTAEVQEIHQRIKVHYLALAGDDTPYHPTLDDLAPLIEAVHHACRAGEYEEGFRIYRDRIDQGNRWVITNQLGAYETELALIQEFFPNGDPTQEPLVSKSSDKSWILNESGFCLMNLGRLAEAVSFYERANKIKLEITKDWHNASVGYRNLANLHICLGELAASADAAREALALARRAESKLDERNSLCLQATAAHLYGEVDPAGDTFRQAETLQRKIYPTVQCLCDLAGILYADHLRRIDDITTAGQITDENLRLCKNNHWDYLVSQCHRVLGDLDADALRQGSGQANQPDRALQPGSGQARQHYDEALRIARGISLRHVLIEALLARGRWAAKQGQASAARNDLDEALGYALEGGYRIYEADLRVALAWAHLAAGNPAAARAEASRAQRLSESMGYYWGQVDAKEVLGEIEA